MKELITLIEAFDSVISYSISPIDAKGIVIGKFKLNGKQFIMEFRPEGEDFYNSTWDNDEEVMPPPDKLETYLVYAVHFDADGSCALTNDNKNAMTVFATVLDFTKKAYNLVNSSYSKNNKSIEIILLIAHKQECGKDTNRERLYARLAKAYMPSGWSIKTGLTMGSNIGMSAIYNGTNPHVADMINYI